MSSLPGRRNRCSITPPIGEKLEAYEPREVRRIIVGHYELRYEIADAIIFILRLWRCRENRSFDSDD